MKCLTVLAICWFCAENTVASADPAATLVQCAKQKGTICRIKALPVPSKGSTIVLPDLRARTELRVSEGQLKNLTQAMASAMGSRLRYVELSGLSMESVFILPNFEQVHLGNNRLSTIEANAEESFALKLLDVRNNRLSNATQLAPFKQLEELYLDDNFITELKMELFARMENLRMLSVARNNLTKIVAPSSAEVVFANLEHLSLAFNALTSIRMGNWQLPVLTTLLLNNNQLVELHGLTGFDQFYSLERLAIAGNRWGCAWLDRALLTVTGNATATSHHAVELVTDHAGDTSCTFEKVAGICCQFAGPESEAEQLFLPEIEKAQEMAALIDKRHEEFLRYAADQVQQFGEHVGIRVEELHAVALGSEPQSDSEEQLLTLRKVVKELLEQEAQLNAVTQAILDAERQQKRLLHFMVEMKNNLVRQAIETDRVLGLVNQERLEFDRRLEKYLSNKTSTN